MQCTVIVLYTCSDVIWSHLLDANLQRIYKDLPMSCPVACISQPIRIILTFSETFGTL